MYLHASGAKEEPADCGPCGYFLRICYTQIDGVAFAAREDVVCLFSRPGMSETLLYRFKCI